MRKYTGKLIAIVILCCTWLACQPTNGVTEDAKEMESKMSKGTFTLRIGEQKALEKEGLVLTFLKLIEDSRCPTGVTCVWEGNAAIAIQIESKDKSAQKVTLNTHGSQDMLNSTQAFGHIIKLHQLAPWPDAETKTRLRDIEATLSVGSVN